MKVDSTQFETVFVDIRGRVPRVGADASKIVRKAAADIQGRAQIKSPVDTGFLRSSIGYDVRGDGRNGRMEADIGATADYAAYVEFGTRKSAPQPFMIPALDAVTPSYVEALELLFSDRIVGG